MNIERREVTRLAALKSLSEANSLGEAIADAIEAALAWQPKPTVGLPTRWGCGCDSGECRTRRDQSQDAGVDPQAIVSYTCITHALVGRSHCASVADGLSRLDAQALLNLDLAHQEQCR